MDDVALPIREDGLHAAAFKDKHHSADISTNTSISDADESLGIRNEASLGSSKLSASTRSYGSYDSKGTTASASEKGTANTSQSISISNTSSASVAKELDQHAVDSLPAAADPAHPVPDRGEDAPGEGGNRGSRGFGQKDHPTAVLERPDILANLPPATDSFPALSRSHVRSPPPSLRAFTAEYRDEPRPPMHASPTVEGRHVNDYALNNPLLSPRLEAISEVTEDVSLRDLNFTPDIKAASVGKDILGSRVPALSAAAPATAIKDHRHNGDISVQSSIASFTSPSDRKGKGKSTGPAMDDSLFDSPLAIPSSSAHLSFKQADGSSTSEQSSPSAPISAAAAERTKRRPPPLAFSPLKAKTATKDGTQIKDILWVVPADAEESEILTPDEEHIGPISPFFATFDREPVEEKAKGLKPASSAAVSLNASSLKTKSAAPTPYEQRTPVAQPQTIPTLVGPNALPYARCPSGIDSFAFNHKHPRPYDPVLPSRSDRSVSPIPALSREPTPNGPPTATIPGFPPPSEGPHGLKPISVYTSSSLGPYAQSMRSGSNSSIGSGNSNMTSQLSANARARLRSEEKQAQVARREQARIEQYGRKEVARIKRHLQEEEQARRQSQGGDGRFNAHESSSQDDQLDWQYDAQRGGWVQSPLAARDPDTAQAARHETSTRRSSQLSLHAQPFVPGAPTSPASIAATRPSSGFSNHSHNHSQSTSSVTGPPAFPFPQTLGQAQLGLGGAQPYAFGHAAMPQQQLFGQHQSAMPPFHTLPLQLNPFAGAHNPLLGSGYAPQNIAMAQAIQELSSFNQNLLAYMQLHRSVFAGARQQQQQQHLSPSFQQSSQMPFAPPGLARPEFVPAPFASAETAAEQVPGLAVTEATPPRAVPSAAAISPPVQTATGQPKVYRISDDPAVVHHYTRSQQPLPQPVASDPPAVLRESVLEHNADTGNVSDASEASVFEYPLSHSVSAREAEDTFIDSGPANMSAPAIMRYPLPPRPTHSIMSAKLSGILTGDPENRGKRVPEAQGRKRGATTRRGETKDAVPRAAAAATAPSPKERDARSSAPSPVQVTTPTKPKGRARDLPTPNAVKSEGRRQRTPSSTPRNTGTDSVRRTITSSAPARDRTRALADVTNQSSSPIATAAHTAPLADSEQKSTRVNRQQETSLKSIRRSNAAQDENTPSQTRRSSIAARSEGPQPLQSSTNQRQRNKERRGTQGEKTGAGKDPDAWKAFVDQRMGSLARSG